MEEARMKMSKGARRISKKTASKMEDGEYLSNSNKNILTTLSLKVGL